MKHRVAALIGFASIIGAMSCTRAPEPQTSTPVASAPAATENVAATIGQLERDWVTAIAKKDAPALDRLLAEDFVGTSPTAHTYTRTNAIDDIKNGKYVVDAMDLDEISVNVYGTTAVSFTSQEEKSHYAGTDTSGHYHFTDVWVKRDGRWQVVASHGTRYDKPAATETRS
jgi:ketosteroid isomerase-like protein